MTRRALALADRNELAILKAHARRERLLVYWLLRAYESGQRKWGTWSVQETMDGLHNVLWNLGYDPTTPRARRLLARNARTRP